MEEGREQGGETEPSTPQYFGDYEVISYLGKGKFAVVYRAHKIGEEENVALKRISVDMMNDKAREKCLKEVRVLQNLDHPNIIRYMDSFICNNDLIIVYEWAAAGDLKRQLRRAQERGTGFGERVIWKYFSQICSAIQHMHEKRIMHRDLKPANIFLTRAGTVKVGDLGLSRELSDNTFQAHSKVGTPLYMSPEVLKGDGYDFKSDIWSLGCLLYELATLKSPFRSEGLNLVLLFQKISSGDYAPLPDTFSPELRSLAASMMSTRPEDRPEISYAVQVANAMREKTMNEKKKKSTAQQDDAATAPSAGENAQENNNDERQKVEAKDGREDFAQEKEGKEEPRRVTVEHDDLHQRNEARKAARSESAQRRGPNPFQRGNSQSSLHHNEDFDKERDKGRENQRAESDDEDEKTVVARAGEGVTLGDYFAQRESEQERASSRRRNDEPWNEVYRPNREEKPIQRTPSLSALGAEEERARRPPLRREDSLQSQPESAAHANSRPSSSRPVSGVHSKIVPLPQEEQQAPPQQPSKPVMYHRSKPPKAPSSSSAHTSSVTQPSSNAASHPATRVSTAEPASRPISSRPASNYSRPTTVDDAPGFVQTGMVDRANPKILEALENASPAFALMDNVYCKLIVLGYPMEEPGVTQDRTGRGRLLPIHFAINVNAFPNTTGTSQGYQFMSFKRMLHVILWLCEQKICPSNVGLQRIIKGIDTDSSTNMTIAKQLLQAAQTAGEMSEDLAAATPSSLTSGVGFNVCLLLSHFADCALQAIDFTSQSTVHTQELVEDKMDESMDEDDSIVLEEEEDERVEELNDIASSQNSVSLSRNRFTLHETNSKIDPLLWKQETERVAALLKKQIQTTTTSNSSWHAHLDLLAKYCATHLDYLKKYNEELKKNAEAMKKIDPMERPLGKQGKLLEQQTAIPAHAPIAESLSKLKAQLQNEIQRLTQSERYMNIQPSLEAIARDYSTYKKEHQMYEENSSSATSSIGELTERLSVVEEQLAELQEILNSRLSGEDDQGTGRILRIKDAILNIQKEIREMHINAGIANHELIARQKEHLYAQERLRKEKYARRRRKAKADDASV